MSCLHLHKAVGVVLVTLISEAACAMCVPATDAERVAAADIVFEGRVVRGPDSPARLKVLRYIKGGGPKELSIETGNVRNPDGTMSSMSIGITPHREATLRSIDARQHPAFR